MEIVNEIIKGIKNSSNIELVAVIIGFCYISLIALKSRWGWCFAFVSSALYVYLSFSVNLYFETGLQSFYVFMAIYGWITWNKPRDSNTFIVTWPIKYHLLNIGISTVASLALGYLISQFTQQNTPYLDAFTTVFSLTVTFMAAHRVLENWLYWIFIDVALIFLYAKQGFYLVGLQYLVYTVIAVFAFFSWYKTFKTQRN